MLFHRKALVWTPNSFLHSDFQICLSEGKDLVRSYTACLVMSRFMYVVCFIASFLSRRIPLHKVLWVIFESLAPVRVQVPPCSRSLSCCSCAILRRAVFSSVLNTLAFISPSISIGVSSWKVVLPDRVLASATTAQYTLASAIPIQSRSSIRLSFFVR